jgi:hypothetical protein
MKKHLVKKWATFLIVAKNGQILQLPQQRQ